MLIKSKLKKVRFAGLLLSILILLILAIGFFIRDNTATDAAPILKVVTRTPGAFIFSGANVYYYVYENGVTREIPAYDKETVDSYRVEENYIDGTATLINSTTGSHVNSIDKEYLYNIVELVGKQTQIQNPDIYKLYILDTRYIFDVFNDNSSGNGFSDVIFEYLPNENRIEMVAEFKSKNIEHIELA
jgi:hypothetical protein